MKKQWYGAFLWLAACMSTAGAGLACLSDPCIHGVCIDDVNRFVTLPSP